MTIPEILKELETYTGRFPKKAMLAAVEQREAITPKLLQVLERAAADPVKSAEQKDYMLMSSRCISWPSFVKSVPTGSWSRCSAHRARRRSIWPVTP